MTADEIKKWTIKGIEPETRNAAVAAAARDGTTIGDWVTRAIREKIQADQGRPRVPAVVAQPAPVEVPKPVFSLLDIATAASSLSSVADQKLQRSLASLLRGQVRAHRVAAGHLKPRAPRPNGAQTPA